MLNILDGYPVLVPVKGSFRLWRPKVVFFTSDRHPREWLFNVTDRVNEARQALDDQRWSQLERRITLIEEVQGHRALGMTLAITHMGEGEGGLNIEAPPPPSSSAWENVHLPQLPFDVVPDSEYRNEVCNQ